MHRQCGNRSSGAIHCSTFNLTAKMTRWNNDKWVCEYCHDNFHEACKDFEITSHGIVKCTCICNTPKKMKN